MKSVKPGPRAWQTGSVMQERKKGTGKASEARRALPSFPTQGKLSTGCGETADRVRETRILTECQRPVRQTAGTE